VDGGIHLAPGVLCALGLSFRTKRHQQDCADVDCAMLSPACLYHSCSLRWTADICIKCHPPTLLACCAAHSLACLQPDLARSSPALSLSSGLSSSVRFCSAALRARPTGWQNALHYRQGRDVGLDEITFSTTFRFGPQNASVWLHGLLRYTTTIFFTRFFCSACHHLSLQSLNASDGVPRRGHIL